MPLIKHEEAIKQYWEEVKDKYPNISYAQFEIICKSPFKAVKEWIKGGGLPIIMLKYFGKFRVMRGTIIDFMKDNQKLFDKGIRPLDVYQKRKEFYENYLKDLENEVEDYEIGD
jgi:hypothetical protein